MATDDSACPALDDAAGRTVVALAGSGDAGSAAAEKQPALQSHAAIATIVNLQPARFMGIERSPRKWQKEDRVCPAIEIAS
jgi:hypothetical protein